MYTLHFKIYDEKKGEILFKLLFYIWCSIYIFIFNNIITCLNSLFFLAVPQHMEFWGLCLAWD